MMRNIRHSDIAGSFEGSLDAAFQALEAEKQRLRADDGRWRPHVRKRIQALRYRLRQLITEQPYISKTAVGEVLRVDKNKKLCTVSLGDKTVQVPYYPPSQPPREHERYTVFFESYLPLKTMEETSEPVALDAWIRTAQSMRLYMANFQDEIVWFPWPVSDNDTPTVAVRIPRNERIYFPFGVTGTGKVILESTPRYALTTFLEVFDANTGEQLAIYEHPPVPMAAGLQTSLRLVAVDAMPGSEAVLMMTIEYVNFVLVRSLRVPEIDLVLHLSEDAGKTVREVTRVPRERFVREDSATGRPVTALWYTENTVGFFLHDEQGPIGVLSTGNADGDEYRVGDFVTRARPRRLELVTTRPGSVITRLSPTGGPFSILDAIGPGQLIATFAPDYSLALPRRGRTYRWIGDDPQPKRLLLPAELESFAQINSAGAIVAQDYTGQHLLLNALLLANATSSVDKFYMSTDGGETWQEIRNPRCRPSLFGTYHTASVIVPG